MDEKRQNSMLEGVQRAAVDVERARIAGSLKTLVDLVGRERAAEIAIDETIRIGGSAKS